MRKARFRLGVSLCREGVEPSGFQRKVSVTHITSSLPRLLLARPKVRRQTKRGNAIDVYGRQDRTVITYENHPNRLPKGVGRRVQNT